MFDYVICGNVIDGNHHTSEIVIPTPFLSVDETLEALLKASRELLRGAVHRMNQTAERIPHLVREGQPNPSELIAQTKVHFEQVERFSAAVDHLESMIAARKDHADVHGSRDTTDANKTRHAFSIQY